MARRLWQPTVLSLVLQECLRLLQSSLDAEVRLSLASLRIQ